jgi:hypothetical protein
MFIFKSPLKDENPCLTFKSIIKISVAGPELQESAAFDGAGAATAMQFRL